MTMKGHLNTSNGLRLTSTHPTTPISHLNAAVVVAGVETQHVSIPMYAFFWVFTHGKSPCNDGSCPHPHQDKHGLETRHISRALSLSFLSFYFYSTNSFLGMDYDYN
jgi:hypothetical protein